MKTYRTVEFWTEVFSQIQDGTVTAPIVDPGTGEVVFDAGDTVDAEQMRWLGWIRDHYMHARRINASGRQVCCRTCHTCGSALGTVLDGELWCDTCEAYR